MARSVMMFASDSNLEFNEGFCPKGFCPQGERIATLEAHQAAHGTQLDRIEEKLESLSRLLVLTLLGVAGTAIMIPVGLLLKKVFG
jgi:hypothetical protein